MQNQDAVNRKLVGRAYGQTGSPPILLGFSTSLTTVTLFCSHGCEKFLHVCPHSFRSAKHSHHRCLPLAGVDSGPLRRNLRPSLSAFPCNGCLGLRLPCRGQVLHCSDMVSSASRRATNCGFLSITEHSFQGILSPSREGESVTHVSGTMCYLCSQAAQLRRTSVHLNSSARDTRLNRTIVLKVLHLHLARCLPTRGFGPAEGSRAEVVRAMKTICDSD